MNPHEHTKHQSPKFIRNVTWKQIDIATDAVAHFLTDRNFQPGQFHLVTNPNNPYYTTIVYVVNER